MNVPIHRRFDAGMTEQFLQHFWLHPAFDCTRCIGVAQSVHTESPDSCLIAQFVKVGIIGTVLCRFPGTPVDKNKITHTQACSFSRAPIHVFQRGVEQFRFLSLRNLRIELFQDVVSMACQGDGAIALLLIRCKTFDVIHSADGLGKASCPSDASGSCRSSQQPETSFP